MTETDTETDETEATVVTIDVELDSVIHEIALEQLEGVNVDIAEELSKHPTVQKTVEDSIHELLQGARYG